MMSETMTRPAVGTGRASVRSSMDAVDAASRCVFTISLDPDGKDDHQESTEFTHGLQTVGEWERWYHVDNDRHLGVRPCRWDVPMEDTQTPTFGSLLRRFRRDADLTQEELAERAGLSVRTVSDLERGISQAPYQVTIQQLADALNLAPEGRDILRVAGHRRRGLAPEAKSSLGAPSLPLEPNQLVGRERNEAEAVCLLRRPDVRMLTLTGVGGVGKTRLALRIASTVANEYADGAVFVPLAGVQDPTLVPSAIAEVLGVQGDGAAPMRDRVMGYCASRRILLVLDNFEHVTQAALLLSDLLKVAPGLAILVTSRVPLHLQGEHELSVPPLSLPDWDVSESDVDSPAVQLAHAPAVELFLQRARAIKPELMCSDDDIAAVTEICRRLDGLPLAIELAAARIKVLTPRLLLARLDRRLPLLTGGARDLPSRHQTMRNTIAWSYDLLSEDHQRLFRHLSVFVSGVDVRVAEELVGHPDLLDAMSSLVDQSLMKTSGNERFTMLETVREYGLEALAAHGEEEALQRRHVECLLTLAERAGTGLTTADEDVWLRRLEDEHDNIRAALRWTLDSGDTTSGLRLAGLVWRFWYTRGHFVEGERWLTQLLEQKNNDVPDLVRAVALYAVGAMAFAQSRLASAIERWTQALVLFRAENDLFWIGSVLNGIGTATVDAGDYERAAALLEESLTIRRELGDPFALAATQNNLANLARYRGRYRDAERLYEESLTLFDRIGVKGSMASTTNNLALVALELGDIDRAETLSRESLRLYEESESVEQRIGCRINLGDVALERKDYLQAQTLYEACLRDYAELGDPGSAAGAALGLGQLALAQGDLAAAVGWADDAERLFGPTDRRGHMNTALLHGDARLAGNDIAGAAAIYAAVLRETHERGMALTRAQALDRLGCTEAAAGHWERATMNCAAAETLLHETGAMWSRSERARREAWLDEARRRLGLARFEELCQRGREQWESVLAGVLSAVEANVSL